MISNKQITLEVFQGIKVFFSDVDGTLTDGCTYYSVYGEEMKKFNHKDGRGAYLLRKEKILFGMITGEDTMIVKQRALKLQADYCFLGIENKLEFLKSFCEDEKIDLREIAYIGDDTNDLDVIKSVGLSFAVSDAMPDIMSAASIICQKNGGDGAFREAVEYLLSFRK